VGNWLWVLEPVFSWADGLSGAGRISEVVSPGSWFVVSRSLLPTGQVVLSSVVAHYQMLQGGQICFCLCQAAAELLQSHFGSAPPPRR
jgi:hypothetical protein